jgi:DNA-binding MarR family transcriptional regulator
MSYKLLERRFYHLGVSASQARVLAVLHFAEGPIKPSLVATLLFQETQSITGILHRIESRGWVRRLPDPNDRRAVGLELTDQGREITAEIVRISEELYQDMFGAVLTAADKRTIETILKKVRSVGFKLPETDFKLRRAQQYGIWRD